MLTIIVCQQAYATSLSLCTNIEEIPHWKDKVRVLKMHVNVHTSLNFGLFISVVYE